MTVYMFIYSLIFKKLKSSIDLNSGIFSEIRLLLKYFMVLTIGIISSNFIKGLE